jgi:hypothetical protein
VELPVAAWWSEPKNVPAMLTNCVNVKYNNKIIGIANKIIPRNTESVSYLT